MLGARKSFEIGAVLSARMLGAPESASRNAAHS